MKEDRKKFYQKIKEDLLETKRKKWAMLREEYFKKLGEDYRAQFDNPQDMEDMSLLDLIEDTGLKVADIHKEELVRIEEAMTKLDDGTYGVCDGCNEEIDEKRLKLMPFTALCVDCQKKKESRRA